MKPEEIDKIATLARIELSTEEKRRFAEQLTSILGYFQKLQELDTREVPPLSHSPDQRGPTRPDEPCSSIHPVELVRLSQCHQEPFFVVPRVLEGL